MINKWQNLAVFRTAVIGGILLKSTATKRFTHHNKKNHGTVLNSFEVF